MLRFLNPANLVTLLRIALVPVIAVCLTGGRHLPGLILFFIAGFTDVIDGALARRYGWNSSAGAYLDPIADKLLLTSVYLCLALAGGMPWWFVALVFARDILILSAAGAALAFTSVRKFPPSLWGKLSTFLQIVAAIAWMTRNAFPTSTLDSIARVLIWPAALATVWSGAHYAWRGAQLLRIR
jgi:cardiolipin synthase